MEAFVWNMAISFQLLFMIVGSVIFFYIRDRSFKYYALYNVFLALYVFTRSDAAYYGVQGYFAGYLGEQNADIFMQILNFYIQIVFYIFYSFFALYFLDIDKRLKRYFSRVLVILRSFAAIFLVAGVVCYMLRNPPLYISLYTFIFLPVMLTIFVITVIVALRVSGKHKHLFLTGVCAYVFCALVAFAGTFVPSLHIRNPIDYFFIGIIIETLFFSLGLAYKMKLINDDKNRVNNLILQHRHQQEITKLESLVEGEERERKRWAEELHDGISGGLAAIKLNIFALKETNTDPKNTLILKDLSDIIENSCAQLREISHNLSPSSVVNHGLLFAVEQYCSEIKSFHHINIECSFSGEVIQLSEKVETHIYRIIQELVNNLVKHAEATAGSIEIHFDAPEITIVVKDNGKGFTVDENMMGIGLSNINSRARFLNARVQRTSGSQGSTYIIYIDTRQLPRT